ncbi:MAG: hypothetical protein ACE148_08820 [Vicinamibacterales bacterium]
MNATFTAMGAGAAFGLWSLIMSLSGLRSGGVAMMLLAGTFAVTAPWYFLFRPEPFLLADRSLPVALVVGFFAACINGVGMVLLPRLLEAPPAVVGMRIMILNVSVVTVAAIWSITFGGQALTGTRVAGLLLAVAAVYLLSQ